ncbi:MAG: beta-lactamase family protein [Bacteroidetes bacterium]|jgi:CubicO group peptidase (beta-lactamase class C family)|nr:beta-lactamase family protein [Bacteroidota bacterium]
MSRTHLLLVCTTLTLVASCATTGVHRTNGLLEEWTQPGRPGGTVLVAEGDRIHLSRGFGSADVEANIPNGAETNYRLASVTKQFTAMSVLILRDRGSLTLEDPITDFFPEGPAWWRSISVKHLLTHTSGLVDYEDAMPETTTVPVLDCDVLQLVKPVDTTYFVPGSRYRYSNTGYALLALIVERRSGLTFATFLQKEIFGPAGMQRSVAFENGISAVDRRAYGYSPDTASASGFRRTDQSMTSSVLGDGGIYSSATDLLAWHRALLSERLVSRATLDEAFTPHATSDDGKVRYGYGWMIEEAEGERVLTHSGSTVGFRNFILRIPEREFVVIVLMNRADGEAERLARALAAEYDRKVTKHE